VLPSMLRAGLAAPLIAGAIQPLASPAANAPASTSTPASEARDGGGRVGGPDVDRLEHVVVIYLENHSFDNLYGEFAGAAGLAAAGPTAAQVDSSGRPYTTLPQVTGTAFPATLANAPFSIERYIPADKNTSDLTHRFYQEQLQIDGGKMDRFAVVSEAKGLVMGFYHTAMLPLAREAVQYTLCDNFFHAAFGGSFLNHIWFIAARSPVFPDAPDSMIARLDASGHLLRDGAVTPDGHVVNTAFTVNSPHPPTAPRNRLVPSQTFATIGDRLSAKGVTWAWYSGGWKDALAGHPDSLFQYHHQPFAYFAKYADGTPGRAGHLKDETEFLAAARAGTLPAVSFVKPLGEVNEHPGYSNVLSGERHAEELIQAVRNGPQWTRTAIIVTYDENGGFWDHVPPPVTDRWGPGTRVPTLIISPFARRGYVDHTLYDTTSILAFLERRWRLEPLTDRDAHANDLTNAFDFGPGQ
jgi:phospholipase C